MNRLINIVVFGLICISTLTAQTEIGIDGTLDCPYFRSPIVTGGKYFPGCPANCYIYIPHLYYFADNYEYSIDGGSHWQRSPYFGNISPGDYNISLRLTIGSHSCTQDYPLNPVHVTYRDFSTQIYHSDVDSLEISGKTVIDTVFITRPATCGLKGTVEIKLALGGGGTYQFSMDGQNFQSSRFFYNVAPGKYPIYVREIGMGCTIAYRRDINVMPVGFPEYQGQIVNWWCDDGEIRIIVSDSSNCSFSIDGGNNWQSSRFFDDLAAGHYAPRVRKNGCILEPAGNELVGINTYKPQVFDLSFAPGPCDGNGSLNGKIYVPFLKKVDGGIDLEMSTNGTNYTHLNPVNLPDFQYNIPVGTTRIYVRVNLEPEDCLYYFDIDPTTGTLSSPTINKVQPSCLMPNGEIHITPQDNNTFEYSINNGANYQSSPDFSALAPGNYQVTYRNPTLTCFSDTVSVTLTNQNVPPIINNVISSNVTDCGLTDGKITIQATPGTGALSYSIDNGSQWQGNNIFTGLDAGTFNIKVRNDNASCEVIYTNNPITITKPTPPAFISVTHTDVTDCGLTDGNITISATPGSSDLEFSINNGTNWQSSGSFTGLDGGSYQVAIRNDNGTCRVNYPANPVVITKPVAPAFNSVTATNTTDCNVNDGKITITATPGSSALRYSINNGASWQNSGEYNSLSPANYLVKLKNADNTCVVSYPSNPVVIPGHTAPVINDVSSIDVSDCGLTDGEISITATMGEGSILYSIDNGGTWSSNNTFDDLDAGLYNAKIKNNNSTCIVSFTFNPIEINEPVAPQINSVNIENVSDCNLSDGEIQVNATPGSSALQYSDDSGSHWQSSGIFSGLDGGDYYVSVRNDDGTCRIDYPSNPINITEPIAPSINSVQKTDVSDCDVSDGTITINATPGSSGLEYSIDNGTQWQASATFTSLPHGSYYIMVRNDDVTCEVAYTDNPIIIAAPAAPSIIDLEVTQPTTCLNPIGTITILYENGSSTPQFSIDGGSTWGQNNTFTDLVPGAYYPGIRNADGSCESINSSPVILTGLEWPEILNVETQGQIGCAGQTATIVITADGSDMLGLQYSIDNGGQWQSSPQFPGLGSGDYFIKVKYETNVCEVTYVSNPVPLTRVPDPVINDVQKTDPASCTDQQSGSIQISAIDPSGLELKYSINNGANWQTPAIFSSLAPGVYFVKVKNNLGCSTDYEQNPVQLNAPSQPLITGITDEISPDCNQSNGSFTLVYSQSQAVQFSIDNGLHWSENPHFTNLNKGNYYLKIRNADGNCENAYLFNPYRLEEHIEFTISKVNVSDPTDCGISDGRIEVQMMPQDDYLYSLDDGAHWQTSPVFSGLSAGNFFLKIKLNNSTCILTYQQSIRLSPASAPTFQSIDVIQPGCSVQDGKITIRTNDSGIEYSIDSGQHWQVESVFSNLMPGNYFVAIRYHNSSCVTYAADSVVLRRKITFAIQQVISQDDTDCQQANGRITIQVDRSGLMFSIDNGAHWQPSNIFSGLSAGVYFIQVQDTVAQCLLSYSVPIVLMSSGGPEILLVDYISTQNCNQQQAQIAIHAPEADQFSIDAGIHWTPDSIFNDLDTGLYRVAVRKNECITMGESLVFKKYKSVTLSEIHFQQPTNCSTQNGFINIKATPINDIAGYSIDGGLNFQDSADFTSLDVGVYHPVVKNSDGCEITFQDVTLYANADLLINDIEVRLPENCFDPEGSIIVHLANFSDWRFSIDQGEHWQQDTIFGGLPAGKYRLIMQKISDSCLYSPAQFITIESKNRPAILDVNVGYPGDCVNGVAECHIEATGSNNVYSLDAGAHWQDTPLFAGLADGLYSLLVRDTLTACLSKDTSVLIWASSPDLNQSVMTAPVSQCMDSDGQISILHSGQLPFQYSIDDGLNWQSDTVFSGLHPGNYNLIAENMITGCQAQREIRIGWRGFDPDSIQFEVRNTFCAANGAVFGQNDLSGTEYSLTMGTQWQPSLSFYGLAAGNYTLEVRNDAGCLYSPGIPLFINASDTLPYDIDLTKTPTCTEMKDGIIRVKVPADIADEVEITWPDGSHGNEFVGSAGDYPIRFKLNQCISESWVNIPISEQQNFEWQEISDTALCSGSQVLYGFDDPTYSYFWQQNNRTSQESNFWAADGVVHLTVRDTSGCVRQNGWLVTVIDEDKDLDFLLPVEGLIGVPVVAIDISDPKPDSIRWEIDQAHLTASQIFENQLQLIYNLPGNYTVQADIWSGDCHVLIEKECKIYSTKDSLQFPEKGNSFRVLANMQVYPSPNTGSFKLSMEYNEIMPGTIFIYNSQGNKIFSKELNPQFNFELEPVELLNPSSGLYSLIYRSVTGEIHWRNFVIVQ